MTKISETMPTLTHTTPTYSQRPINLVAFFHRTDSLLQVLLLFLHIYDVLYSLVLPWTALVFPQNSNHLVAKEAVCAALIIAHMCTPTPVSCHCVLVYLIEEADSIPSSPGGTTLSVFTSNSTSPIGAASVCVRAFRILKAPLVHLCTY